GAFDASKGQRTKSMLDFLQIRNEVITPQRCPFADGGQLGRLKMRKAQCG
ncbi:unnamed protein product, partial [marine sediment metagenome]